MRWIGFALLLTSCTCDDPSSPETDAEAGVDAGHDSGVDAGGDADNVDPPDAAADAGPVIGPCDDPCPDELSCCTTLEGAACVDLAGDPTSCGVCGAPCGPEAPLCRAGACAPCEAVGQTTCDGFCVAIAVDDQHCGACNHECLASEQCIAGLCVGGVCGRDCALRGSPDEVCCLSEDGRESCTNLREDENNCGACGTACHGASRCDGGLGRCICNEVPLRIARCGDECLAVDADPQNCGACDIVCPGDVPDCVEGRCVGCENQGFLDCGADGCTDPATDERHCGGCDHACAPGQECVAGDCIDGNCDLACDDLGERGPICCDDGAQGPICTTVLRDAQHCGGCRQPCAGGEICQDGVCAR